MVGNKIIYKRVVCLVLMISVFSCCSQADAGLNRLSDSNNSGSSREYYSLYGEASDVVWTYKVFDIVDVITDQNEDDGEKTVSYLERQISENVVNYGVWARIRRWFRMLSFCCMGARSARVAPTIDI